LRYSGTAKLRRERHQKLGLCKFCSQPRSPGLATCIFHRRRRRERREQHQKLGFCIHCSQPKVPGLTTCESHRARKKEQICRECHLPISDSERQAGFRYHKKDNRRRYKISHDKCLMIKIRKWRSLHPLTKQQKLDHNRDSLLSRNRKKLIGQCIYCKKAAVAGVYVCKRHLLVARRRTYATRAAKRNRGECLRCKKPAESGHAFCVSHHIRQNGRYYFGTVKITDDQEQFLAGYFALKKEGKKYGKRIENSQ